MNPFGSVIEYLKAFPTVVCKNIDDHALRIKSNERQLIVSIQPIEDDHWLVQSDWLLNTPKIIASKIINELGLSKRIYARKCVIGSVSKSAMEDFLREHHIIGVAGAKHKIGLFLDEELVAIATFAAPRLIQGQRSAGLIRFCGKSFHSIPGGLNKLLVHYIKHHSCDDIFTYVNLEWGNGNGFKKVGFVDEGIQNLKGNDFRKFRLIIDKSSSHQHT